MIYVWLGVVVMAIVAEAATTDLIAIWFMPAALVSLILAVAHIPLWIQVVVFIALVVAFLALSKTFLRKYLKKHSKDNRFHDCEALP